MYQNTIMLSDLFATRQEANSSTSDTWSSCDQSLYDPELLRYDHLIAEPSSFMKYMSDEDRFTLIMDTTDLNMNPLKKSLINNFILANINEVVVSAPYTHIQSKVPLRAEINRHLEYIDTENTYDHFLYNLVKDSVDGSMSLIFDNVYVTHAYAAFCLPIIRKLCEMQKELKTLHITSALFYIYYCFNREETDILINYLCSGKIETVSIGESFLVSRKDVEPFNKLKEKFYLYVAKLLFAENLRNNFIFQQLPITISEMKQYSAKTFETQEYCLGVTTASIPLAATPILFMSPMISTEAAKFDPSLLKEVYKLKRGTYKKSFVCSQLLLEDLVLVPKLIFGSVIHVQKYGKGCKQVFDFLPYIKRVYDIMQVPPTVTNNNLVECIGQSVEIRYLYYIYLQNVQGYNLAYITEDGYIAGLFIKNEKVDVMQLSAFRNQRYFQDNIQVCSYNYFVK